MTAACAAAIALASLGATSLPASAASIQFNSGIQFRNDNGRDYGDDNRFERRGNSYYLNGQRGQRQHRSGWRQYNGFYFPQSAFSISLNFGDSRDDVRVSSDRHVAYCEDRYVSYRESDNSFQPYHGNRQQCIAPFDD